MFENLSDKLSGVFKRLKGYGKLSERNIKEALKEVRMALLEADVNYKVVKTFIADVESSAIGAQVMESLTPGQQFVKIFNEKLTELMGGGDAKLDLSGSPPVTIMLAGLHGCGKTTSSAKLALHLKKKGKRPYLVPADVYRPAAIEQLTVLAKSIGVPVYGSKTGEDPVGICRDAKSEAAGSGCDVVIIDTAGRLHIDDELMGELEKIQQAVAPQEILLVADAMTGQDAVNIAKSFNERLELTGIVLTKLDGDARGGAALSVKAVTSKPIKFVGMGEKLEELEVFHPDRMSSRILGMGDVLSLIEKAETMIDEKKAAELEEKLRKNAFNLEDFRDQLRAVRKMGSLEQIMGMIPGMGKMKGMGNFQAGEKELVKIEAIINSMTKVERADHTVLNGSRRKRIARGSGTSVQDVNRLIKQYAQARKMIKNMNRMGMKGMGGMKGLPFG